VVIEPYQPPVSKPTATIEKTPSIRILSPNGGESYSVEEPLTLRWSASNVPAGGTFLVEFDRLDDDGDSRQIVLTATTNRSARSVTFPSIAEMNQSLHIVPGTYRVSMGIGNVTESSSAHDDSDGTITITAADPFTSASTATLSTILPKDNATISIDSGFIPMQWEYENIPVGSQIVATLALVGGGSTGGTWQSTEVSGSGSLKYSWPSPSRLGVAGTYRLYAKIRKCHSSGCSYYYTENESLPVSVVAPNVEIVLTPPAVL
jgi:hypothetical protein